MRAERIRVAVKLRKDADADAVLASAEEALGHPVQLVHRLRSSPVLSLWLLQTELDTVRMLPGVERAAPEGRISLPPAPKRPEPELK